MILEECYGSTVFFFDILIIALLFFYTRNFSKKSVNFVGNEFFTGFYNVDDVLKYFKWYVDFFYKT